MRTDSAFGIIVTIFIVGVLVSTLPFFEKNTPISNHKFPFVEGEISLLGCANYDMEFYNGDCLKINNGQELIPCVWFHDSHVPLDELPQDGQYCLHLNRGISIHYTELLSNGWISDSHYCSDVIPMECENWHKIVDLGYHGNYYSFDDAYYKIKASQINTKVVDK